MTKREYTEDQKAVLIKINAESVSALLSSKPLDRFSVREIVKALTGLDSRSGLYMKLCARAGGDLASLIDAGLVLCKETDGRSFYRWITDEMRVEIAKRKTNVMQARRLFARLDCLLGADVGDTESFSEIRGDADPAETVISVGLTLPTLEVLVRMAEAGALAYAAAPDVDADGVMTASASAARPMPSACIATGTHKEAQEVNLDYRKPITPNCCESNADGSLTLFLDGEDVVSLGDGCCHVTVEERQISRLMYACIDALKRERGAR